MTELQHARAETDRIRTEIQKMRDKISTVNETYEQIMAIVSEIRSNVSQPVL